MTKNEIPGPLAEQGGIPNDLEGLRSWIKEEIDDEELLARINAHPEFVEQFIEGNDLFAKDMLAILEEVREKHPDVAGALIDIAMDRGRIITPHVDRITGVPDTGTIDHMRDLAMVATHEAVTEKIGERKKVPFELALIDYTMERINQLREAYGLNPTILHSEQIHMNKDKYVSLEGSAGDRPYAERNIAFVRLDKQELGIGREESADTMMEKIDHELVHLNSYASFVEDPNTKQLGIARVGLEVFSRKEREFDEPNILLRWLNEAITEETACRIFAEIPEDHPELGDIVREEKKRRDKIIDAFANTDAPRHRIIGASDGENGNRIITFAYNDERIQLDNLMEALIISLPGRFGGKDLDQAKEEIFTMLQKAMFTGNLIPFARIMREAFGPRSFEKFARLNTPYERREFIEKRTASIEHPESF